MIEKIWITHNTDEATLTFLTQTAIRVEHNEYK